MGAKYYENVNDVLFISPIMRIFAKIVGAKHVVCKCKTCGKIPTELYGDYCFDHRKL